MKSLLDARTRAHRFDRPDDRLEEGSLLTSSQGWSEDLALSPRECEITRLVARDRTNKEIAAVLEISEWTVATHLRRIFAKLGVHSKAAMVARVLDRVASAQRDAAWRPLNGSNPVDDDVADITGTD